MSSGGASPPVYLEGDTVLGYHGDMIYECKILKHQLTGGENEYYVHWQGWNKKWDVWLKEDKIMAKNESNLALQAKVNSEAAAKAKKTSTASDKPKRSAEEERGRARKIDPGKETVGDVADAVAGKINTPFPIKRKLVEDWENITQKRLLVRVPRVSGAHTVQSLLDAFVVDVALKEATGSGAGGKKGAASGKGAGGASASSSVSSSSSGDASTAASGAAAAAAATDAAALYATPAAVASAYAAHVAPLFTAAAPAAAAAGASAFTGAASSSSSSSSSAAAAATVPSTAAAASAAAPTTVRAAREVMDGLRQYFDRCLPIFLLFRFERAQYEQLCRDRPEVLTSASALYGPEHLLRLIVKLPELLAHAALTQEEHDVVVEYVNDLLKFLQSHAAVFFAAESYSKAPPEYCAAFDAAIAQRLTVQAAAASGGSVAGGAGAAAAAAAASAASKGAKLDAMFHKKPAAATGAAAAATAGGAPGSTGAGGSGGGGDGDISMGSGAP